VPAIAPRIPPRLLDAIERLSRRNVPIAEINRLVGVRAEQLGLSRPSYEQVRVLVHAARALRASVRPVAEVALEFAAGSTGPRPFADRLTERRPRLRDRATLPE
jgi:hypothetical protein